MFSRDSRAAILVRTNLVGFDSFVLRNLHNCVHVSENDAIYFTLTSPTDVATRSALVLVTKDSFLSLVTNLKNKNKVCKQSISLFAETLL